VRAVVAGSSGLIGTALVSALEARGDDVVRLVRRAPSSSNECRWSPSAGVVDSDLVRAADVVIDLAGAGIGDRRLTTRYARTVLESRLATTSLLSRTLADGSRARLIQASAVGYYGDRGDERLDERATRGEGIFAELCERWEGATAPARDAGVPTVLLRTGIVLAPTGGLARRLRPAIRLGALRSLGSGRNWFPWVTLPDAVAAILLLVDRGFDGPVNVVAPTPTRGRDLVRAIAAAHRRPALVPVPRAALRAVVGPAADDLLASRRVVPAVLDSLDFAWRHPTIDDAARWLAARSENAR
jgi:uncharacterized protein (TIGR01777 family)